MPALTRAEKKIHDVEIAARLALVSQANLEQAIRSAREAGTSLREIAKAAGVSHEQVRRIVQEPQAKRLAELEQQLASGKYDASD